MTISHHTYRVQVTWTGNTGSGTSTLLSYSKNHVVHVSGKPEIPASADPAFRGDPERYNPEELLVAALSQCHMLWYLSRCAKNGIVVTDYRDEAVGTMVEHSDGGGEFTLVTLHPQITLANPADRDRADALHDEAHRLCFISRSVNFPVETHAIYII